MFKLHNIKITNFRSYKGSHEFEFPTASGLYFFTGDNLVQKGLGANGAGKTTFIDAITWCLYGQTTRGLKATDVLSNWVTSGCSVALTMTVGTRKATVKRTQKPNNLTLDDKIVDQTELEKYLRVNLVAFLHSVLNAQFGTSFFSLPASAKLNLFSDIMNLDHWLRLSDEAAKRAKELLFEIEQISKSISHSNGQLEAIADNIKSLGDEEKNYEAGIDTKVESLGKQLDSISKNITELQFIGDVIKEIDNFKEEFRLAKRRYKAAEGQRDYILMEIQSLSPRVATLKDKIQERTDLLGSLANVLNRCPTCEQLMDRKSHSALVAETKSELAYYQSQLSKIDERRKTLLNSMVRAKLTLEAKTTKVEETQAALHTIEVKAAQLEEQHKSANDRITEIKAEIARTRNEANPFVKIIQDKQRQQRELSAKLKAHKSELSGLESHYVSVNYWVKGFKRIRLHVIEQAFQTLELEVNNCLSQLGMDQWEISFSIERENKSGGVTKGFIVLVTGPNNKTPVRWENWSGGETQRLQLAGDLGLSNLIMQQVGLANSIELYDEPSTHLSAEGMVDLANMLHERALSERKTIWIIDHSTITNYGEFEGIIRARKDDHGSTISLEMGNTNQDDNH